jgi:hypothetical protein
MVRTEEDLQRPTSFKSWELQGKLSTQPLGTSIDHAGTMTHVAQTGPSRGAIYVRLDRPSPGSSPDGGSMKWEKEERRRQSNRTSIALPRC